MSTTIDKVKAAREATSTERDEARELDRQDALASLRSLFDLPADEIYLDGNSLGAMPASVGPAMAEALSEGWAKGLIRSWNGRDWHMLPVTVGDRLAPLMGAKAGEVLAADSTSVNLYKVFCAAMRLRMLSLREGFAEALRRQSNSDRFDFIARQRGMFSRLGLTGEQVSRLRADHGVYIVGDSRFNVAGLPGDRLDALATKVVSVL